MTLDHAAQRLAALSVWEHGRYDRTLVSDLELDARACEAAAEVLAVLAGEGAGDARDAVRLIQSQPLLAQKYRALHEHFEVTGKPQQEKSGKLLCPACFRTVLKRDYYCRWCGKRIQNWKRG